MALRQYIGARYVTKIYENSIDPSSAEWEASVTYEPLTLVTYQNSSYLSKKDVPGSVGNPAANPEYWVVTGAYNGQIATLQNQIDNINNVIIPAIQSELSAVGDLSSRSFLFIMDSYAGHKTTDDKYVNEKFSELTGAYSELEWQSGGGFVNGHFTNLINTYSGDASVFDSVVVIGGANDEPQSEADIVSAMTTFVTAVHTNFINVKNIYIFCPGLTFNNIVNTKERVWRAYKKGALQNKCHYIENSQYILRSTYLLESDYCHPNNRGADNLAAFAVEGIKNGSVEVHYRLEAVFTNADTTQSDQTYIMTRDNAVCTLTRPGGGGYLYYAGTISGADGSSRVTLGTFNHTLINNNNTSGNNDSGALATYKNGSNESIFANCEIRINNKTWDGFITTFSSNDSSGTKFYETGNQIVLNN